MAVDCKNIRQMTQKTPKTEYPEKVAKKTLLDKYAGHCVQRIEIMGGCVFV